MIQGRVQKKVVRRTPRRRPNQSLLQQATPIKGALSASTIATFKTLKHLRSLAKRRPGGDCRTYSSRTLFSCNVETNCPFTASAGNSLRVGGTSGHDGPPTLGVYHVMVACLRKLPRRHLADSSLFSVVGAGARTWDEHVFALRVFPRNRD